jgi:septal ring factor EnvC (AmiA/AmiB activator)
MRALGNLLIVDRGEACLSIYGNNESLSKQPGESVSAGKQSRPSGRPVAARNRVYTLSSGIWASHPLRWLKRN